MDTYGELVERVLFPLWEERLRGRPTLDVLRHLERTQWRPLEEIEALQLGALRRLLSHAYAHVPFYRARMDACGLRPTDVRTLDDLRALPILTRADARAAGDARASVVAPLPTIRKATSGSSGDPLAFAYDAQSEWYRKATKLRGYAWAGQRVGTPTLYFWGSMNAPQSLATRAHVALDHALKREWYFDCGARSDADLARVVEALRARRPNVLVCYAQAGAELARYVLERGVRDVGPLSVVCAAEALLPQDRAAIVEAFGERVFETYGAREVMLIAAECEAHAGMHLSMENLIVELVVRDATRERPAEPGESGEVVVTDLHNYGMPFIRYANGDRATLESRARCACGRTLPRLRSVDGRVTETLVDANGGHIGGLVLSAAMVPYSDRVRAFQLVQHPDRSVDVRVVGEKFDPRAEAGLLDAITPYFHGLPVRVERVPTLATGPSGKRPIVVVEGR